MTTLALHYYRYHQEDHVEAIPATVIPYYDLTMVLGGTMEYRLNNRRLTLTENDVILLPPGTKRERFFSEGKTSYVSFNFRTDEDLSLPIFLENAVNKEMRMMLYACHEIDRDRGEFARAAFEDMTSALLNAIRAHVTRSSNSELTQKILAYLHENYRRPISLKRLAQEMNYSVVYCDQAFKKDVGMSIVRYLIDYRIAKVKEYLMENLISLKQIAEQTGFGDCNYLSRQFKQRTGISPLRFRKQFNT